MSQPEQDSQSTARWWEFYAVRYGMGSVVGAIIFFFLCSTNPVFKPMLFGADAGKIDGTTLALLAGYGLAFCYIASAPILVFHVSRFLLQISMGSSGGSGATGWRRYAGVLLTLLPPIGALIIFALTRTTSGIVLAFYCFVFWLASMVIWPQYLAIGFTLAKTRELLTFYEKLAGKRKAGTGGIVESYRHMREHGNSFLIVVLEMILAIILFTAGNLEVSLTGVVSPSKEIYVLPYIMIIFLWIIPAAAVWLVGTLFERRFSGF